MATTDQQDRAGSTPAGSAPQVPGDGRARLETTLGPLACSLCAGVIERGLHEQPGVEEVSVDPADGQALIDYDPERASPEELLEALEASGFARARPPERAVRTARTKTPPGS